MQKICFNILRHVIKPKGIIFATKIYAVALVQIQSQNNYLQKNIPSSANPAVTYHNHLKYELSYKFCIICVEQMMRLDETEAEVINI